MFNLPNYSIDIACTIFEPLSDTHVQTTTTKYLRSDFYKIAARKRHLQAWPQICPFSTQKTTNRQVHKGRFSAQKLWQPFF